MQRNTIVLLLAASTFTATASAQRLFVPDQNDEVVIELDGFDGSLVNPVAIDLGTVTSDAVSSPFEVITAPGGELWVSDRGANTVFRLSPDGTTLLGTAGGPLDQIRGLAAFKAGALVSNDGGAGGAPAASLVELDGLANTQQAFGSSLIDNPFDVEPFRFNGVDGFLVSSSGTDSLVFVEAANPANQQIFHASDGVTGIDGPAQVHVSATGRVFVAGIRAPAGLYEYDPVTGDQIGFIDSSLLGGPVSSVFLLGNGNLLYAATFDSLRVFDVVAMTSSVIVPGVTAGIISELFANDGLGTPFCAAVTNSTGSVGRMSAQGSSVASANDVELTASALPNNAFGFMITSQTQGFVMNPGASAGNLCLAGDIGRYVGPGQVQNSGSAGSFSLALDLTQTPQPNGLVGVLTGETWNFQAWHRDTLPTGPTSNYTQGLRISFQ